MEKTHLFILIYLLIGTLTLIFPLVFEVFKEGLKSLISFKRNSFEGILGIILVLILLALYLIIYPFLLVFALVNRLRISKSINEPKIKTIRVVDEVYNRVIEEKDVKSFSNKVVETRRYKYNEHSKISEIEHYDNKKKLNSINNFYYNSVGKKCGEMVEQRLAKTKTQNFYLFDEQGREIKSYGEFDNHKFYNEFSYNKNGEKRNNLSATLADESNLLEMFMKDVNKQPQLI